MRTCVRVCVFDPLMLPAHSRTTVPYVLEKATLAMAVNTCLVHRAHNKATEREEGGGEEREAGQTLAVGPHNIFEND